MFHQLKNRNFYIILGADLLFFAASLILSYGLRFSFSIPAWIWRDIFLLLPFLLPVKAIVFFLMGVYRGMWRYASIPDAIRLAKASLLATLTAVSYTHLDVYKRQ